MTCNLFSYFQSRLSSGWIRIIPIMNAVGTTELGESFANESENPTRKIADLSNPGVPKLGYMYP